MIFDFNLQVNVLVSSVRLRFFKMRSVFEATDSDSVRKMTLFFMSERVCINCYFSLSSELQLYVVNCKRIYTIFLDLKARCINIKTNIHTQK